MTHTDFLALVTPGPDKGELVPIALLLKCGYGCVGHFHKEVNAGLADSCILLNAQIVPLGRDGTHGRPAVDDFSEFLEDVVASYYHDDQVPTRTEFGKVVPLVALPLDEVAVMYPVSRITQLVRRIQERTAETAAEDMLATAQTLPTLLDLSKSEIVTLLRTKIW